MPTHRFDISQSEEVARFLGISIEKVGKRALLSTAIRMVQHITTVIIPREDPQPVDRAAYRAGWRAKQTPDGAKVWNGLPYSSIIEWGARPEKIKISRLMIIMLAGWVLRKGFGLGAIEGKNAAQRKARRQIASTKIAWAIAMSMKKKGIFNRNGTKGLRVLEKALKMAPGAFAEELKREIEREYR